MRTKILVFAVLVFALALSACGPTTINQEAQPFSRTMNVNGIGMVDLTPDIAYIYIGVHDESATASEAVDANKTHTTAVINAIKKTGVDKKDILTNTNGIITNKNISRRTIYNNIFRISRSTTIIC